MSSYKQPKRFLKFYIYTHNNTASYISRILCHFGNKYILCAETSRAEPNGLKERMSFEKSGIDGSTIWEKIKDDNRMLEIHEGINKHIATPTSPSGVVQLLFCISCAGIGALFLLMVYHTLGPGTFSSEPTEGTVMELKKNNTVIQCVCSAQPSVVVTQFVIVMLVVITSGGAAFFIYFYDQKANATSVATLAVNSCQEVVRDREHAINELVAKQKMDMVHLTHAEIRGKL